MPIVCANCRTAIPEGVHPYTIRIELFPRVEESLQFTQADLELDFDEEIKDIIAQLEAMNDREQVEEEERVYSSFSYTVCASCRNSFHERLRRHIKAMEGD